MDKPARCPDCGSERVATIIYGLPAAPDEEMQKQLDGGTITFGGCVERPGNPTWVCSDCGADDGRCPYFAYGSNMDTEQMRSRCPGSRLSGNARLAGYRFIINSRGVATVVCDEASTVHGVLWQTTGDDESSLDRYEGVGHGLYTKEHVCVETEAGEAERALIYIAADSTEGEPRDGYMGRIVEAAGRAGLPDTYVDELNRWVGA